MKSSTRILILSLCILLLIVGVILLTKHVKSSSDFTLGDGGFLTGKPCAAPCFMGIVPGTTTKEQAIALLNEQGITDINQPQDTDNVIKYRDIIYIEASPNHPVWVILFKPEVSLTVHDVINKYGPPDTVQLSCKLTSWRLFIVYEYLRTIISVRPQEDVTAYSLSATTEVTSVVFYSEKLFAVTQANSNDDSTITAWMGFGNYQTTCNNR